MSITKDNGGKVILQERNYYPFGLLHQGYNEEKHEIKYTEAEEDKIFTPQVVAGHYKYWYQEQERQTDLDLNWDSFKYRNYDYAIGRFMNVDPLAEKYPYNGVYNFSENRVIDGRELEGLEYYSAVKYAKEKMIGFPTAERGWYYSFNRYRDDKLIEKLRSTPGEGIVCYESVLIAYAQGDDKVADYLSKEGIPLNRADAYNHFFREGGKYHSFLKPELSDIEKVDAGDVMFKGEASYNEGHAALVAGKPVFNEDKTEFTLLTLSAYAGENGTEFTYKQYTFVLNENGQWVDKNSGQALIGFGRVDEQGIKKENPKNEENNIEDEENNE